MGKIEISLKDGGHEWEKLNLVTVSSRKGSYDEYRCKHCGVKVRSYHLGCVTIDVAHVRCKKSPKTSMIKITHCTAVGPEFENLTPRSIHSTIAQPEGEDNTRGEWVMGVKKPVLVLYREFEYVE